MGQRGRYGKYGEHKRMERLRRGKAEGIVQAGREGFFLPGGQPPARKTPGRSARPSIRPARPSDAEHVYAMSHMFRAYGPYPGILREWLESGMAVAFIGLINRKPGGFAMLGRISGAWYFPRVAELLAIAVKPAFRRRGLGSLMLKEVEEKALALGAEKLVLHTAVDNVAAQTLFLRRGFKVFETLSGFYPEGQDALGMVKELGII